MINNEMKTVRKNLDKIKDLKSLPFQKWLIDYSNHIKKMKIRSTTVHGDFNPNNILVNMNNSLVTVIDWERFYENGNPFYDLTKLIYHVLTPNSCVDEFMKNIRNVKKNPSLVIIKEILTKYFRDQEEKAHQVDLTKYFQYELNVVTLLRFYFLNDLALNKNINKPYFLKLLGELSKIH
jgi:thiamine kinase-like enzyme